MQGEIICIECSGTEASVAVIDRQTVVAEHSCAIHRHHMSVIFDLLEKILTQVPVQELCTLVVGSGPGSYGGIRVGMAVADAFNLLYGTPLAAFSSWNGFHVPEGTAYVIGNARRGDWTLGQLENGYLVAPPCIITTEQLHDLVFKCHTESIPMYSPESTQKFVAELEPMHILPIQADASLLGLRWNGLPKTQRAEIAAQKLEPIYIRDPHITTATHPAWHVKTQ